MLCVFFATEFARPFSSKMWRKCVALSHMLFFNYFFRIWLWVSGIIRSWQGFSCFSFCILQYPLVSLAFVSSETIADTNLGRQATLRIYTARYPGRLEPNAFCFPLSNLSFLCVFCSLKTYGLYWIYPPPIPTQQQLPQGLLHL